MSKRTIDDLRFELNIYLTQSQCEDVYRFIEEYENALLKSKPMKVKHFGLISIPMDLYNACKQIVPEQKLNAFIKRIYHTINTSQGSKLRKYLNQKIIEQFESLYEEYSNVTTEEARKHYN